MKKIFLALILSVTLVGCSKPIPKYKMDYVGQWESTEMSLSILSDRTVAYVRKSNGVRTYLNSSLKEFIGDDFVVGVLFLTTTFEVTEPPNKVNGQWQMVVDVLRLTRVN